MRCIIVVFNPVVALKTGAAAELEIGVIEEAEEAPLEVADNHVNQLYATGAMVKTMLREIVFNGNDGKRCLQLRAPQSTGTLRRRVFLLGNYIGLNPN